MIIRDAVFEDLGAIVEIYNSTIPGRMVTADTENVTIQDKINWFNEHSPGFRPLWVMEENISEEAVIEKPDQKQIIGWLSFQSFYGRPAYNATAEVSIYIHPEHRRKGYGKVFLQKAIDFC